MGEIFKDCYECGKTCINTQFCLDGDTPNNNISLPRTLRVKVIANPEYWGFGTLQDNVLVSGAAYYSNGHYDFFYGYDENHVACKTCGRYQDPICSKTEQRPDIAYRSVIDENGNVVHYSGVAGQTPVGAVGENLTRGGAEVFLINRQATQNADNISCDSTDPETVFKKTPDNYGFGNKILFNDSLYKNITGAWRLSQCSGCYDNTFYVDNKLTVCNISGKGISKQNIRIDEKFGQYYDRNKICCSDYDNLGECIPDGAQPDNYRGNVESIQRNAQTDNVIKITGSYKGGSIEKLTAGSRVFISTLREAYTVYDVEHSGNTTSFYLFGTYSEDEIDLNNLVGQEWIIFNTADPQSCCGGSVYGLNDDGEVTEHPYHVDIGKIFNNTKNIRFSDRKKFGNGGSPRKPKSRIETSGGYPILAGGDVSHVGEVPYYGPYYLTDQEDSLLRYNRENHTTYNNKTCYTKKQELTIFPDCLVQKRPKKEYCQEGELYKQNTVPRLAFVYRPCNYNSPCEFADDNRPWTAGASGMPSSLEDLKRGFGGQEIVMYLNLGSAWGNDFKPEEKCGCGENTPPGVRWYPPSVIVDSPITFPCFPKFDLYPSGYGCQDPMWWGKYRQLLDQSYDPAECIETPYNACWTRQPYTTYGYIRNLCGHKDNSRIDVLKSLAARQHQADYLDTNPNNSGTVEPMYVSFPRPMDDTGLGFPTGGNNGFIDENEDGVPDNSGQQQYRAFWGLTDNEGRLAFPYFRTKIGLACSIECPNEQVCASGVTFDYISTITDGFPTSHVPFLIEIDHDDYCVGCPTNQIEDKQYYITLESLPAKYLRGSATANTKGIDSDLGSAFKYGFNYCKYPGVNAIPKWEINPQTGIDRWMVPTGCSQGNLQYVPLTSPYSDANPYTGETCGCLGYGVTVPLRVHKLIGTDTPKYLSTDGGVNSYVPLPSACSEPRDTQDKIMKDYTVYFAAHMHCGSFDSVITTYDESNARNYGDLATLLKCGGCSHSYPATNSKPNLSLDFWYVRKGWESWFESFTDADLRNPAIVELLAAGATFGFIGPDALSTDGEPISIYGLPDCPNGKIVGGICYPIGDGDFTCNFCNVGFAGAGSYYTSTCSAYRDGRIRLVTSIPGCEGSIIRLYGYSYFNTPSPSAGYDGGFGRIYDSWDGDAKCCDIDSCNLGRRPTSTPQWLWSEQTEGSSYRFAKCHLWDCGQFKTGCSDICGALKLSEGCYERSYSSEGCCRYNKRFFNDNGAPRDLPMWQNHCFAQGEESKDLIGEFIWRPAVSGCPAGFYGTVNACDTEIFFSRDSGSQRNVKGLSPSHITMWKGINLPKLGNVVAAPGEPIAKRATNSPMQNVGISTCALDSSVNKNVIVKSEFSRPTRLTEKFGYDSATLHLGPVDCEKNLAGSVVPATCVRPIFPNTMAGLSVGIGTGVVVNRETSYPEIMTVHRIQCHNSGYALHVTREFYNHSRTAFATQKYVIPGPPSTLGISAYPIYGKIDGGRKGVLYENPSGNPNNPNLKTNLYFQICNTGTLPSGSKYLETLDYPFIVPMMARSDYNSPCYPDYSGTCVYGEETFYRSTCVPYYDPKTFSSGVGAGASGYFQSDNNGNLSFILTSSGSGYSACEEISGVLTCTGCAFAIYDNPCAGVTFNILESGAGGAEWVISTGIIDYDGCAGLSHPECCYQLYCTKINGTYICPVVNQPLDDCVEYSGCGGGGGLSKFPPNTTWPVTILSCDVEPKLVCTQTAQTCDDGTPIYPNLYNNGSGVSLYNHYNLTYDLGVPDVNFLTDASIADGVCYTNAVPGAGDRQEPFPKNERTIGGELEIQTGFVNGSLITDLPPITESEHDFTCSYSCLQDATICGGEFFNNKEFFPRRKYKAGTKVTKYGSLSICAQNAEHSWGSWLSGHVKHKNIDTMQLGGLDDIKYTNLVDPSKDGAYTVLTSDVDIEDDIIYVEELTTLLGAKHPFFKLLNKQSLDSKSCLMPNSGCFEFLPTHNMKTSQGMLEERFFSGEDVYFTDREIIRQAIANNLVGTNGCLLEPFKIMVDVEPCNERLSHPGTSYPMNLSWVVNNIPAGVCRGWLYDRGRSCGSTTCDDRIAAFGVEAVFGKSDIKTLYRCSDPIDSDTDRSFCQWDSPITSCFPGECGNKSRKEYRVFKGADEVEYLYLDVAPTYGETYRNEKENQGGYIDMSCYHHSVEAVPPTGRVWPHCAYIDYEEEQTPCRPSGTPPVQRVGDEWCFPQSSGDICPINCRCQPIKKQHYAYKAYSDIDAYPFSRDSNFCRIIAGVTRLDTYLLNTLNGCPHNTGPVTGYRDINMSGIDQCTTMAKILDDYNCYQASTVTECPFPSVIKVTITE